MRTRSGFVGADLCRKPADGGMNVVGINDLSTGRRENVAGVNVELWDASVLDTDALDDAMAGCDAVVHLAAVPSVPRSVKDPVGSWRANADGALAVLKGARRAGVGHVVFASSSSVYDDNPRYPITRACRCPPGARARRASSPASKSRWPTRPPTRRGCWRCGSTISTGHCSPPTTPTPR